MKVRLLQGTFADDSTWRLITSIFAGLCLVISSAAKDIYVAQNNLGSGSGADASNALPLTWLNSSSNWGNGGGQVGPGDTVHLVGTFTTQVVVAGNGTTGSPVRILFESAAKLSAPTWPWSSNGAIYGNNRSYVVIDGGTNGKIECLSNGTLLANHVESGGVVFYGSHDIEVKNLTVTNLYVRVSGDDQTPSGECVSLTGGSNLSIHNCNLSDAHHAADIGSVSGDSTNYQIYSNSCWRCCVALQCTGDTFLLNGIYVHDNYVWNGTEFDNPGNTWHRDGYHSWGNNNGSLTNQYLYNNTIIYDGAASANISAFIYPEGGNQFDVWIYNNLLISTNGSAPGDGFIYFKAVTRPRVYNNTFFCASGGSALIVSSLTPRLCPSFKNNICIGFNQIFDYPNNSDYSDVDYNFYSTGSQFSFNSFSTYRSNTGQDAHSAYGNSPLLDRNWVPTALDTVAKDKGVSLASFFTTDKRGLSRPQGPAWDMGAYEFQNSATKPAPPQNLRILSGP
jgi:hypothetical protein